MRELLNEMAPGALIPLNTAQTNSPVSSQGTQSSADTEKNSQPSSPRSVAPSYFDAATPLVTPHLINLTSPTPEKSTQVSPLIQTTLCSQLHSPEPPRRPSRSLAEELALLSPIPSLPSSTPNSSQTPTGHTEIDSSLPVDAEEDTQVESSVDIPVVSDGEANAGSDDGRQHDDETVAQNQVESRGQSQSDINSEESFIGFKTYLSDTTGLIDGNENRIKPGNE